MKVYLTKNKHVQALFILLFVSLCCQAQQQPSFSQYMYNTLSFNPAYAGSQGLAEANISAGGQFMGIEGAARSMNFSVHGQALSARTGLGFMAARDEIGVSSTTQFQGSYAYRLISRNKNSYSSWSYVPKVLSLGLSAGISRYHEDLNSLGIGNDPNFHENITRYVPHFGVGVYYSNDPFYIGLSIPQLVNVFAGKQLNLSSHIYLNGGTYIKTGTHTSLHLSTLLKYVKGAPLQLNATAIMTINDKVEVGTGWRSVSAVNLMTGLRISQKFRLAYFYEFPLSNREIGFNQHELMLNFRFLQ